MKNPLLIMAVLFSVIFLVLCKQESNFARNLSSSSVKNLRKKGTHQTYFPRIYASEFSRTVEICDLNNHFDNEIHEELSTDNGISSEGKQLVFNSQEIIPVCESSNSVETKKQNELFTTKSLIDYTLEDLLLCRIGGKTSRNLCAQHFDQIILNYTKECSVKEFITSFEKYVYSEDSIMDSYFGQTMNENENYFKENFDDNSTYKNLFSNLYDDSKLMYCVGISKQQLMLAKQNLKFKRINFNAQKFLSDFQKSFEHQFKVKVTQIKNSDTDVSSVKYSLNKILEKNIVNNLTLFTNEIFTPSLLNNRESSKIDQNKKYFADYFTEEVVCLNVCGYQIIFPTLYDEIFVINIADYLGGKYPQIKVELTGEPLTHMVCPQSGLNNFDYTVLVFSGNDEYLTNMDTSDIVILENEPNSFIPTIIFDDKFVLSYGDELLESQFLDTGHYKENIVNYSPLCTVEMVIDLFNPEYAPEMGFGVTVDLYGRMKSNDTLVENFDSVFSYLESFLGAKPNNQAGKEFTLSVMDQTRQQ